MVPTLLHNGSAFPSLPIPACRGFTLIEVLVAMTVLSIAGLGIVGMQLAAHRANQQSAYATIAVQLARDMAERIRANPGAPEALYQVDTRSLSAAPGKRCFAGSVCTPGELAVLDGHEWSERIVSRSRSGQSAAAGLPGGRGLVCRDHRPWKNGDGYEWACSAGTGKEGGPLVVKVGWLAKPAEGGAGSRKKATPEDRPQVVLVVKP